MTSPVAIFVGGTRGIGAALAKALVASVQSSTPEVHIVGRSKAAADGVLSALKDVKPEGTYEFHDCDVSSLASVRQLLSKLKTLPKINYLVLSPGILTMQGRTETSDGNDVKMMLHYYSRMLFLRDLLPNLQNAADNGEPARAISILDALRGNPSSLHKDDLDLKKNYGIKAAADHCITMNDSAIALLASQNPNIGFSHVYPGTVKTDLLRNQPVYMRLPLAAIAAVIAIPVEECADRIKSALLEDSFAKGAHYIDNKGKEIPKKKLASTDLQQQIWAHTEKVIDA